MGRVTAGLQGMVLHLHSGSRCVLSMWLSSKRPDLWGSGVWGTSMRVAVGTVIPLRGIEGQTFSFLLARLKAHRSTQPLDIPVHS